MAELRKEYIDVSGRMHTVEHQVVQTEDGRDREHIIEELVYALTSAGRHITDRSSRSDPV